MRPFKKNPFVVPRYAVSLTFFCPVLAATHKNKHTFEEMVFFSLVMGMSVKGIMEDLHKLGKGNEE